MGNWNSWDNSDYAYVMVKEDEGLYSWTLKNMVAGDKGRITTVGNNDKDKGYNEITEGKDLVTEQTGDAFAFASDGTFKVFYNAKDNTVQIQKLS